MEVLNIVAAGVYLSGQKKLGDRSPKPFFFFDSRATDLQLVI